MRGAVTDKGVGLTPQETSSGGSGSRVSSGIRATGRKEQRPRSRSGWRRTSRALAPIGVLVALGLIWQLITSITHSLFIPTMSDILARAFRNYLSGPVEHAFLTRAFFEDVLPSVERLLLGWALAVLVGVSLGLCIGLLPRVGVIADRPLQFVRSVPPPALIPLFIVLFGIGSFMKIVLIASAVIWPVLLNTIDGVRSTPQIELDTGRVFHFSRRTRLTHIILPSAAPKIFAGVTIGMSIAIVVMVVSEMFAATNGIGFLILRAQRDFEILDMWAGIVVLGIIGVALNAVVAVVEGKVLRWHRGAKMRGRGSG